MRFSIKIIFRFAGCVLAVVLFGSCASVNSDGLPEDGKKNNETNLNISVAKKNNEERLNFLKNEKERIFQTISSLEKELENMQAKHNRLARKIWSPKKNEDFCETSLYEVEAECKELENATAKKSLARKCKDYIAIKNQMSQKSEEMERAKIEMNNVADEIRKFSLSESGVVNMNGIKN